MQHLGLKNFGALVCASVLSASASAMTINPNGTGQVLIYPYYTVNKHQQTIFSVGNTTAAGKAIQIMFHEGYDGKIVYAVDVFLAPFATWSANVFAPEDGGQTGTGAAIVSTDTSCTYAIIDTPPATPVAGFPFNYFSNIFYTGSVADGGPTTDARQREGFVEAIEMSEIQGDTLQSLYALGSAPTCASLPPATPNAADFTAPQGGLVGGAAAIDVSEGTFFAFEPRAIDGFRTQAVVPPTAIALTDAGDSTSSTVSASINYHGDYLTLTFPRARAIDAVSALFMADTMTGEADTTQSIAASTDWVLTFPTKQFYVDPNASNGLGPFESLFGDMPGKGSPVTSTMQMYTRSGSYGGPACDFDPCPTVPAPTIQYQTQVFAFGTYFTNPPLGVLGSALLTPIQTGLQPITADLSFVNSLGGSDEGFIVKGVPVFGTQAINYVNGNVTAGVLSNYSGTAALRTTVSCTKNDAACQ